MEGITRVTYEVDHYDGQIRIRCYFFNGFHFVDSRLLRDNDGSLFTFDTDEQAARFIEELKSFGY